MVIAPSKKNYVSTRMESKEPLYIRGPEKKRTIKSHCNGLIHTYDHKFLSIKAHVTA